MKEVATNHKTDPSKVKKGDLMAFVYWTKVEDLENQHSSQNFTAHVTNLDTGSDFFVRGNRLVELGLSADQFAETVKESKTAVATYFMHLYNTPFTVNFFKDDGTERTLRGRLIKTEPVFGKSLVEDLDKPASNRLRWVRHENINYVIANGVKRVAK